MARSTVVTVSDSNRTVYGNAANLAVIERRFVETLTQQARPTHDQAMRLLRDAALTSNLGSDTLGKPSSAAYVWLMSAGEHGHTPMQMLADDALLALYDGQPEGMLYVAERMSEHTDKGRAASWRKIADSVRKDAEIARLRRELDAAAAELVDAGNAAVKQAQVKANASAPAHVRK